MSTANKGLLIFLIFLIIGCQRDSQLLTIVGDVEDPKGEITHTIADLINKKGIDSIKVKLSQGSLSNLDSLEKGVYQFMVIDNYVPYREQVSAVIPLYPQILHIIHKNNYEPKSIRELVEGKKVYAGLPGSSTEVFVKNIFKDFQISENICEFVNVMNLFQADVIFSFTDLISPTELIDLQEYTFYSLDDINATGTIADAICLRYPQFETYTIPKMAYGNFTPEPILTVTVEALLVCKKELDEDLVYDIAKIIHENKQAFNPISPLLYHGIDENFDTQSLSFTLHPGARRYLERHAPTFFERYAELFGVVLSIIFAVVSGGYTFYNYRKNKRKNKIDIYLNLVTTLRYKIPSAKTERELDMIISRVRSLQNETLQLLTSEKLSADESYLIFMNLAQQVSQEAEDALKNLERVS